MCSFLFLFDVGVPGGGGAIAAGVGIAFFLLLAVIAFVVYRLLRKAFKWWIRLAIVGVILLIGLIGAIGFVYFSSTERSPPRPSPTRQR